MGREEGDAVVGGRQRRDRLLQTVPRRLLRRELGPGDGRGDRLGRRHAPGGGGGGRMGREGDAAVAAVSAATASSRQSRFASSVGNWALGTAAGTGRVGDTPLGWRGGGR